MQKSPEQHKGLITHKRKSLHLDLCLIAKNSFCLFDLLLYIPFNKYGHVDAVDVKQ